MAWGQRAPQLPAVFVEPRLTGLLFFPHNRGHSMMSSSLTDSQLTELTQCGIIIIASCGCLTR